MNGQLADSAAALRLFFTEEVYLVADEPAAGAAVPLNLEPQEKTGVPEQSAVPEKAPVWQQAIAGEQPPLPEKAPVQEFKHLGGNQKNVLILVNDPDAEVSTGRGRELLRNMVKAIQLSAADFALVNYAGYTGTSLSELSTFFSSRLVLVFGVSPGALGLNGQADYTLHQWQGMQLIFAAGLDQLAEDQQGKKDLWKCFKQLT